MKNEKNGKTSHRFGRPIYDPVLHELRIMEKVSVPYAKDYPYRDPNPLAFAQDVTPSASQLPSPLINISMPMNCLAAVLYWVRPHYIPPRLYGDIMQALRCMDDALGKGFIDSMKVLRESRHVTPYYCVDCDIYFQSGRTLQGHVTRKHKDWKADGKRHESDIMLRTPPWE
jgi:hypothetical protein